MGTRLTLGSRWKAANRALIREAERAGWIFTITARGHAMGHAPDEVASMTVGPANERTLPNARRPFDAWQRAR
jgi:hypothetical protein